MHFLCSVRQFHIRELTGWWWYDSTHDYLWLFEQEPKTESGPSLQIKKKQWGVVFSDAGVLVADKVTRCGAPRSFLSAASPPCTHTRTHTALNVPAYLRETRALSPPTQSFCLSFRFISSQSFIWEMESEQLPPLTCRSSRDLQKEALRRKARDGAGGSHWELWEWERRSQLGMAESKRWKE